MEELKFKSNDSELFSRNGQRITVVGHITEPDDEFDAEVLPMVRIRFTDGFETAVWPDELTAA